MKDKGFTLVELLAAMVILALLIFIGTMTVSNIFDNTKDNYYKSLENTLNIAGNEYFSDNRADRPIDDYNFVDMETLVDHEYMDELTTYDGKDKCSNETGVYIYNDGDENRYEACLVCGEYKSEGTYCNGTKMGTIHITGNINDKNGPSYNPLLSYSGTKWINASNVWIHFNLTDEGVNVSKYTIYNANGNSTVGDCIASGNKCSMNFQKTGSYYVEAFDGSNKVGNRKYFNVKFDNTPPTMDLKNLGTEFLLDNDKIVYDYENEVININDDNGYKEVKYTLTRYNPNGNENIAKDKDIKDLDFKIKESLQSGKYDLYITVTDFAGNKATQKNTHITFYIKYNVDLQYFDNKDNRHDAGRIKVYTYGKYDNLPGKVNISSNPQEVSWYLNANLVGGVTTSSSTVNKTGYHVLYGKEAKFKVTLGARCNNLTYNADTQQLATVPADEQAKYRLVVYYGGQILANEAIDAKTYTVIAMLNPGYTWDDGTTKAKALQCTIKPYPVDFNPNNNPCKPNLVYNGSAQQLTTTSSCGGAGNWVDTHTSDSSGGGAGRGSISCFGGSNLVRQEVGATYSPTNARNAGSYPVTYHLTSSNFVWADGTTGDKTYTCKIDPKKVSVPANPCKPNLRYIAKEQCYVNLGNCEGASPGERIIDRGELWHTTSGGYSDFPPRIEDSKYYDYAIYPMGADGFSGLHAKEYPIKYTLNNSEADNYVWANGSKDDVIYVCKIDRYQIPIPTARKCITKLVYNGEEQYLASDANSGPTSTASLLEGEPAYYISGALKKDAGSYTVSYDIYNNQNYEWKDGTQATKTVSCSIAKKEISVTWGSTSTHAWDGNAWGRSTSANTGISGETMTLNVTKKTDVGNYNTTATCSSVTNSKCGNYTLSNNTSTFSIVDKTNPTCSISASGGTVTVTGTDNYGIKALNIAFPGGWGSYHSSSGCTAPREKSVTETRGVYAAGTVTGTITDCAGNVKTCSVTVSAITQKRTASCNTYSYTQTCGAWGPYGDCSYYSDIGKNRIDTECEYGCGNGLKYRCRTRSCWNVRNGCSSWNDFGGWSNTSSCSDGISSDYSTKTECQTVYG